MLAPTAPPLNAQASSLVFVSPPVPSNTSGTLAPPKPLVSPNGDLFSHTPTSAQDCIVSAGKLGAITGSIMSAVVFPFAAHRAIRQKTRKTILDAALILSWPVLGTLLGMVLGKVLGLFLFPDQSKPKP